MKEKKKKKRIKLRNMKVMDRMQIRIDNGTIKPTQKEKRLLLSPPDLAEVLLCSDSTIRKLLRNGMPHYKLGTIYRFDEQEVLEWLKQNGGNIK